MHNTNNFTIIEGVLQKYTGEDSYVTIPDGVTAIGPSAFYQCKSIRNVSIPSGVQSIDKEAFCDCHSLQSITIPFGVITIGNKAFFGCQNLSAIELPSTVIDIGEWAFWGCSSLATVEIPAGVTELKTQTFAFCTRLKQVKMPESIAVIGSHVFRNCTSLERLLFPSQLRQIGCGAFEHCLSLDTVILPSRIARIDNYTFAKCTRLSEIVIPRGVKTIGYGAFSDCTNLINVTIPNTVTFISANAFQHCSSISCICIPESVEEIGDYAFDGCHNLEKFELQGQKENIRSKTFGQDLPQKLSNNVDALYLNMRGMAIKCYLLNKDIWSKLSPDLQCSIYLKNHSKVLSSAYENCVENPDKLGGSILRKLAHESPEKNFNGAAAFMIMFSQTADCVLLKKLYDSICAAPKAKKALKAITSYTPLMDRLCLTTQRTLIDSKPNVIEQMKSRYFLDSELTPDLLQHCLAYRDELIASKREKAGRRTEAENDIHDNYVVRTSDDKVFTISANDRFMYDETAKKKYGDAIDKTKVTFFHKRLFSPILNPHSGTVTVGKYKIKCSPFQYNLLVLLLRWSDNEFSKGNLPLIREPRVSKVIITQEICQKFGIDVDLYSAAPLFFGGATHYDLDDFNRRKPDSEFSGDLIFYTHIEHKKVCLEELRCHSNSSGKYVHKGIRFLLLDFQKNYSPEVKHPKAFIYDSSRILGNPDENTIYLSHSYSDETDYYCVFKLSSLRDYYRLSAWLVVALAYTKKTLVSYSIEEYWPDYPHRRSPFPITQSALDLTSFYSWLPNNHCICQDISYQCGVITRALEGLSVKVNEDLFSNIKNAFLAECQSLLCGLSRGPIVSHDEIDVIGAFLGETIGFKLRNSVREKTLEISENFFHTPSSVLQLIHPINITLTIDGKEPRPLKAEIIRFLEAIAIVFTLYNNTFCHAAARIQQYIDLQRLHFDLLFKNPSTALCQSDCSCQAIPESNVVDSAQTSLHTTTMDELSNLVGLTSLKQDVRELVSFVKVQRLRRDRGLATAPASLHMVFTGNPGTGKTTVARILAQIYKEIGVLSTGKLVEVDRSGLVAGYVGQTALKTQDKINEAMGGILFVDEAYTLAKEGEDFGQEAIDTILKAMEDHRDEFIVIVAGNDEPMNSFINSNPGLRSRFNKHFHFPDYTSDELIAIFQGMLIRYEYQMTDETLALCKHKIHAMVSSKGENFANARDVRNFFEKIISRQAVRIDALPTKSDKDVITIEATDVLLEPNEFVRVT